jgi:glycosyltransferase involved in cell wall biosynthesis
LGLNNQPETASSPITVSTLIKGRSAAYTQSSYSVKSVTYIISDIGKALAFEWIADSLDGRKYQLSFILLNPGPSPLEEFLKERNIPVHRVICRGKKDWPSALLQVSRLLKQIRPDVVHCHLLQANIIGLSAAKLRRVHRRIYTRHHSSLHHVFHPKGVFWDKLANKLATSIIAISGTVRDILLQWEGADPSKVKLIPHGFKLESFTEVSDERVLAFRDRIQLRPDQKIIGVISRFTEWKGIQYIIPAFEKYHQLHPEAVLVLMNAQGDYELQLKEQLRKLPTDSYKIVPFENDVAAAYRSMDVFVHVPYDAHSEAFGQTYVEALAAGVPSVFTLSGIAQDFIVDEYNALTVPFKDSEAIFRALQRFSDEPQLKEKLALQGIQSVSERFALKKMIEQLELMYDAG